MVKKVIFVCAPGLPPLDMWLPILSSLRAKLPDADFVFLAPKAGPIRQLDLTSTLCTIAAPIFDKVIFPAHTGKWKQTNNFGDAKAVFDAGALASGGRFLKRLGLAPLLRAPVKIAFRVFKTIFRAQPKVECPLEALKDAEGVVLFDLFAAEIPYVADAIAGFKHMPKFSMLHGLNVLGLEAKPEIARTGLATDNTTALIFSDREERLYRDKYGLEKGNIRVVGIPRHEERWIHYITSSYGEEKPALQNNSIFVISRGSDDHYFPRQRKVSGLRDVQEAAAANNLHVVIKRHPKEADDGPYEEVFGGDNFGRTWSFSNAHALVLGQHCLFAVSFYSGVAIDMVRIGTPVIERLDMKNLPKDALLGSLENSSGNLVSPYRHLGLVLGASNSEEFHTHVENIFSDRSDVARGLMRNYRAIFPLIEGINDKIALEIMSPSAQTV